MKNLRSIMKYRIELTDKQLHLILRAVNLMMRTGIGQTNDLTEWLVTMGDAIKFDISTERGKREFDAYCCTRAAITPVIDGVMRACWRRQETMKSESVSELETIYLAIRHQERLDSEVKTNLNSEVKTYLDVRSYEPIQQGSEPVPKIEKIED